MVNKEKLIFNNVLELVGNTPLVKLNVVTSEFPGSYIAKLDSFNPGHSSKDRIALHIIDGFQLRDVGGQFLHLFLFWFVCLFYKFHVTKLDGFVFGYSPAFWFAVYSGYLCG